jgi:hypothetical protein
MRHSAIASFVVLTVLEAFLVLAADSASAPADQAVAASRTVALTYQVHVPPVKDATGKLLLWLPLRQQDTYQQIRDVQIESPVSHLQRREPEYGNTFLLFQATPPQLAGGFTSGRDLRLSPEQQGPAELFHLSLRRTQWQTVLRIAKPRLFPGPGACLSHRQLAGECHHCLFRRRTRFGVERVSPSAVSCKDTPLRGGLCCSAKPRVFWRS